MHQGSQTSTIVLSAQPRVLKVLYARSPKQYELASQHPAPMSSHRRRLPYLDTIHDQAFYIILARKQLAKKQSEGPRYAAVQRTSIFPASVAHPTPNSSARTGLASSHCLLASFYISGASCSPAALYFPPCCLPPSYLGFFL